MSRTDLFYTSQKTKLSCTILELPRSFRQPDRAVNTALVVRGSTVLCLPALVKVRTLLFTSGERHKNSIMIIAVFSKFQSGMDSVLLKHVS